MVGGGAYTGKQTGSVSGGGAKQDANQRALAFREAARVQTAVGLGGGTGRQKKAHSSRESSTTKAGKVHGPRGKRETDRVA